MGTNLIDICCRDIAEKKLKSLTSIEGLFDQGSSLLDEKYYSVPAFLNFIRDKCAWILCGKGISSPVKVNNGVENGVKLKCSTKGAKVSNPSKTEATKVRLCNLGNGNGNFLDNKTVKRRSSSPRTQGNKSHLSFVENSPKTDVGNYVSARPEQAKTQKNEKMAQKFSLGCESYVRRRESKKHHRLQGTKPVVSPAEGCPVPDISNVDLFPPVGCDAFAKSCRRITPTPVCTQNEETPQFSRVLSTLPANRVWKNAVFLNTPLQDEKDPELKGEREMLKKTRFALVKCSSTEPRTPPAEKMPEMHVENNPVQPDFSKVHDSETLDKLIDAYCYCLEHGLVPNVGGEIYFMFQILTSVGKIEEESDRNSIFGTIHNCVYFAVSSLSHQKHLLNVLDDSTLKTFAEIPYLAGFSEEICYHVTSICDGRSATEMHKSLPVPRVFFQADTDNRENFPNDSSFHSFRKQRDLFYELLRDWQQHNTFDSQFQHQFTKKVQHLINTGTQTINYVHLARLLESQLIASCLGTPESFESYSGALGDIKRSFPDRIEKLEGRFLSPLKAGGTSPASFYGIQTFFCEFIHAASSVALNKHLLDIIACKILELNDHEFLHSEADSQNQDGILNEYSSVLNTLRLLAKFFGYLVFIPYKTTADFMPQLLVAYQLKLRKCTKPLLDVGNILRKALVKQTLVLTVPWIVDYLGMMDPVAMCLDYNQEIFGILVEIYQGKFKNQISAGNLLFLKLVIGWLFDSRNFPQELIFSAKPNARCTEDNTSAQRENIDMFLNIHGEIIYSCCPHLVELKFLLDDYISGIKTTREVRKIKPVPTSPITLPSLSNQQLEQQLEENFFLLHSRSLKKTVEFVADRIASRIIQRIRKEVQAMKLVAVAAVYKDPEFPPDKKTKENREIVASIVNRETIALCDKAKQMGRNLTEKQCLTELEHVIPLLISEDTKEAVVRTCCQISARLATAKVMEWSELNITPEYIKPDIKSKVEHSLKDGSSAQSVDCSADQLAYNGQNVPAEMLTSLRNIAVSIHAGKQDVSVHQILQLLDSLNSACKKEKEPGILKTIVILSVDILLSLIACVPWLCSEEVILAFVSFWAVIASGVLSAEEILCSRNIQFLYDSGDSNLSWFYFQLLLEHLLQQGLFTSEQIQICFNNVPCTKWKPSSQERCTSCVQDVLKKFSKESAQPYSSSDSHS